MLNGAIDEIDRYNNHHCTFVSMRFGILNACRRLNLKQGLCNLLENKYTQQWKTYNRFHFI